MGEHKVRRYNSKSIVIRKIPNIPMSWELEVNCQITGQTFKKSFRNTPKKQAVIKFNHLYLYLIH